MKSKDVRKLMLSMADVPKDDPCKVAARYILGYSNKKPWKEKTK